MNAQLNYDPTDPDKMRLPVGVTCGDCIHIRRCKAIFGHVETDTYCDWSPSRFQPASSQGKEVTRNPLKRCPGCGSMPGECRCEK